ncbi:hypothetical protein [Winogradskya humida]|uniref:Cytochrome b561 bacterial/Ni-hydrogenase domain-containing protein n=1 Tax=Winogradskya humida TaxID=113566 RepID=A0ABQ4A2P4_9ACTN|nr:hypothetical protein [Actinoplanes humidus]GIE24893.1 hypothetical protein Ahu01nite_079950 [Actinoplanes humidus]
MKPIPFEAYHLVRRLTFHVILTLCLVAGALAIIDLYDPRIGDPGEDTPTALKLFHGVFSIFLFTLVALSFAAVIAFVLVEGYARIVGIEARRGPYSADDPK